VNVRHVPTTEVFTVQWVFTTVKVNKPTNTRSQNKFKITGRESALTHRTSDTPAEGRGFVGYTAFKETGSFSTFPHQRLQSLLEDCAAKRVRADLWRRCGQGWVQASIYLETFTCYLIKKFCHNLAFQAICFKKISDSGSHVCCCKRNITQDMRHHT